MKVEVVDENAMRGFRWNRKSKSRMWHVNRLLVDSAFEEHAVMREYQDSPHSMMHSRRAGAYSRN